MEDIMIKVCKNCGAMIKVINDCHCKDCGIMCCGEPMVELKENSVDCAVEKHLPQYEVLGGKIVVLVPHVMEAEHYIEWIEMTNDILDLKLKFKPNQLPKAVFPYIKGSKLSAYCNKHGIWSVIVE